jgi:L-2-hydroxyglutarate oxidase LhgO
MESVDCVVAGAGVVGLAIARALAQAGWEVLLLERAAAFGTGISSRNSEVIHAGIYYEPGSLMARFCAGGRRALYAYCESRAIPHRACGKLIVAVSEADVHKLGEIASRARENGVEDIAILTKGEAEKLEPALVCEGALLSPSTGILDSHAYMLSLLADAEAAGAVFSPNSPLLGARLAGKGLVIRAGSGDECLEIECRLLVNAAGLDAPALAARILGLAAAHVPAAYYAKGNYFTLAGKSPFSRLIYPVPVPGGLGVHLTLDLAGQARFGPDVEWVEAADYCVDPGRAASFYGAIRRYWPGLADGALQPGYAGIRPKIVSPAAAKQDFRIDGPERHGVPGLINLFGIESPGLTASLAIAEYVAGLAAGVTE